MKRQAEGFVLAVVLAIGVFKIMAGVTRLTEIHHAYKEKIAREGVHIYDRGKAIEKINKVGESK